MPIEIRALLHAKENRTKCFQAPTANRRQTYQRTLVCLGHSVESDVEKASAVPCTLITAFLLQTYIYRNTTPPRIARHNEIRVVTLEYKAERDETDKVKQTIKNARRQPLDDLKMRV